MAITRAQQARQLYRKGGDTMKTSTYSASVEDDRGFNAPPSYNEPSQVATNPQLDAQLEAAGKGPYAPGATQAYTIIDGDKIPVTSDTKDYREYVENVNQIKKQQEIDKFLNTPRKKTNLPGLAGAGVNFLSSFLPSSKKFFVENVVGNYDYDMTEEDYQDYIQDVMSGKINAYGRELTDFEKGTGVYREDPIIPINTGQASEEEPLSPIQQAILDRGDASAFLATGGRVGFRMGSDEGDVSGRQYDAPSTTAKAPPSLGFGNPPPSTSGGDGGDGPPPPEKLTTTATDVVKEVAPFVIGGPFGILSRSDKAKKALDVINFFKGLKDFNIITPAGAAELSEDELNIQKAINQKGYDDAINEVLSDKTAAGGGITDVVPDLTNPDVLNKIAIDAGLPTQKEGLVFKEDVATPESASAIKNIQNLKRNPDLEFKADEIIELESPSLKNLSDQQIQNVYDMVSLPGQSRTMAAGGGPVGGIMDLESGRQMYFLGKLVKKATRAVKKIVKSPVGKLALFATPFLMNQGLRSTALNFLFKNPMSKDVGFMEMLRGGLTGGGKFALGAGLTLAPLLFQQEEEQPDFDRGPGLPASIPDIRKKYRDYMATAFLADGGRPEPVAKKTMPLLDMDGKEMDLREEGGFVPIGRMEKADDVPARLSKNEFVFTADAVRNAGEGDIDKGAEVMYNMMKNLEAGGEVSEESQGLNGARKMFQTSQRLEEVL